MRSEELWKRNLKYTPLGGQTLSKLPSRFPEVYPKMIEAGKGPVVKGTNGEYYIDMIAGLGAVSVGYNNTQVNRAVVKQLAKGVSFSLPTSIEADVAERLCHLAPFTEMWKFAKTGTQANEYAVRAARAYTGRTKIMTVGYNGCNDQFEVKGVRNAGVPQILDKTITKASYNDLESFKDLFTREYACVLMEPMIYEYPRLGFLKYLRYMCSETGTLLIFDEVVTGGRFESFFGSMYFEIIPDLITCGKGLANGFPLSAVGGKRNVMQVFERDDFFASGTFGGEAVSLSAAIETMSILNERITKSVGWGESIQKTFNELFRPLNAKCVGYPTRFIFSFPTNEHKALFMQEMCRNGVLIGSANFIMADYTDFDVVLIEEAMRDTKEVMKRYLDNPKVAIKGELPTEALKR